MLRETIFEIQAGIRVLVQTNYNSYTGNGLIDTQYQETYYGLGPDTAGIQTYFYDANGRDTLILSQQIDTSGTLNPSSRQRTTWDSNGNEKNLKLAFYQNGQWDLILESGKGYDLNHAATAIMYPPDIAGSNRINNKIDWNTSFFNNGTTTSTDSLVYRYDSFISVEELEEQLGVVIGPNPFADYLNLECQQSFTVELFSVNGQVIARRDLSPGETTWQMEHLPAGTYILSITQRSQSKAIRLVKR